jgi:hypothetical protein
MIWYSLAISLHVVAAFVLIAPVLHRLFFFALESPAAPGSQLRTENDTMALLRALSWLCLAVLALTGGFVLYYQGVTVRDVVSGELFTGNYGHLLAVKLLFAAALLVLQLLPARGALVAWMFALVGLTTIGLSAVLIR